MLLQNDQLGYWNTLWVMLLDIYVVLTGPERRAVRMALWLAFFDQGCASTAIINYAPQVLERAGVTDYGDATLWSSAITAAKVQQGSIARWPWNALYVQYTALELAWIVTVSGVSSSCCHPNKVASSVPVCMGTCCPVHVACN